LELERGERSEMRERLDMREGDWISETEMTERDWAWGWRGTN